MTLVHITVTADIAMLANLYVIAQPTHKRSYKIFAAETFTCISKNIVYGIMCERCHIIYIGETVHRLADGITEHIRS